jgi:hypothetical protein
MSKIQKACAGRAEIVVLMRRSCDVFWRLPRDPSRFMLPAREAADLSQKR